MKELSIEEKAKAYDEALERVGELLSRCIDYRDRITKVYRVEDIESIFPELKESEESKDERIRKAIINKIKSLDEEEAKEGYSFYADDYTADDCIAWLEKQGKQHSAIRWHDVSLIPQEDEELLVEWDSEDATWHEIAFYHADTKTFWNGTRQVENVTRWCYIIDLLEKQGEKKFIISDDALREGIAHFGITQYQIDNWLKKYVDVEKQGSQILANSAKTCKDEQKTTDKCEGCNNAKGCVACVDGSEWAHIGEKKELKTIVTHKFEVGDVMRTLQEAADNITSGLPVVVSIDDKYYHCTNELISIKDQDKYEYPPMNRKQKSAWSEEDEYIIEEIEALIDVYVLEENNPKALIDWLKSLKDRVGCEANCITTKECSVEDMSKIQRICKYLDEAKKYYADITEVRECIDWLKSLKDRYAWKPSDEQISALDSILLYGRVSHNSFSHLHLNSLFNDLKKLREE